MTTVRIPRAMQVYTRDQEVVRGNGTNVRALINDLEKAYPGLKDALVKEGKLRPGVAVMLDGAYQPVGPAPTPFGRKRTGIYSCHRWWLTRFLQRHPGALSSPMNDCTPGELLCACVWGADACP